MGIFEILFIGIGLAMDAFAVSVCKGLAMKKICLKNAGIIAGYFSLFQTVMPLIGFGLGTCFCGIVQSVDHWIAFILLAIIGGNMIKDSTSDELEKRNDKVDFKTMIFLGLATSIDALAIGITFAFFEINIILAVLEIGIITYIITFIGVFLGNRFGDIFQNKAEFTGGIILIVIGLKILFEHLGIFIV